MKYHMRVFVLLAFLIVGPPFMAQKKTGAIHGKLYLPNEQTVPGMSVELVKVEKFRDGPRSLEFEGQPIAVNADSEYRFAVEPGEYTVRASTPPGSPQARTYFPNTADPEEAKVIRVTAGDEYSADIHLSMTPTFRISGRIVDLLPDKEPHHFWGAGLSSDSAIAREYKLYNPFAGFPVCCDVERVPDLNTTVTLSNDQFEITGVRPGTFDLIAAIRVGDVNTGSFTLLKPGDRVPYSVFYRGKIKVTVTNSDIDNLRVEVTHGADLVGRLESTGKSVRAKGTEIFISGPNYAPHSLMFTKVDRDGRFTFPNLLDGTYRLHIGVLPDNIYVEDIRQGGRQLSGMDFVVSKEKPELLEIKVNPTGGEIEGQVSASGQAAVIILVPLEGQNRYLERPFRMTSKSGDFTLPNIGFGNYRIFAFDKRPLDEFFDIPILDAVQPYGEQGIAVTVKPGVRTKVRLPLIQYISN